MTPIRRILAATDLSERAEAAIQRAAMLAAANSATLDILHVLQELPLTRARRVLAAMPADMQEQVMTPVREHMENLATTLREQHDITVIPEIGTGRPAPRIAEYAAANEGTDLIVIGPHRRAALRNAILGTTAQNLVRAADCSTLVVKHTPAGEYTRVMVPVDFSHHARQAVMEALDIAPRATIHVEHVYEVPYEHYALYGTIAEDAAQSVRNASERQAREDMDTFINSLGEAIKGRDVQASVQPGYPAADIERRAEELDAELIVMGAFGHSDITYALLGSVTVSVMLHSQRDLLAVRI